MQKSTDNPADGGSDYIWGAEAIAQYVKRPPSTIYALARRGVLPVSKIGRIWVTTRHHLDAFLRAAIDARADR